MLYRRVLSLTLKLLLPYSVLLLCFGYTFFAMLNVSEADPLNPTHVWDTLQYALIRLSRMIITNINDDFFLVNRSISNDWAITLLFFLFLILVLVVMINLLIGLAVEMTDGFKKRTVTQMAKNSLTIIYNIEQLLNNRFIKKHLNRFSIAAKQIIITKASASNGHKNPLKNLATKIHRYTENNQEVYLYLTEEHDTLAKIEIEKEQKYEDGVQDGNKEVLQLKEDIKILRGDLFKQFEDITGMVHGLNRAN